MIDFLSGILVQAHPAGIVVQTGGIGWSIPITLSAFNRLPEAGDPVTLPTYLSVKEDSLTLYGFVDAEERELFIKLLQVNGIGPKLAMTVLSGLPASELIRAIAAKDAARLNSIPGIGKKMAERLVVELKDKVQATGEDPGAPAVDPAEKGLRDAVLALVALGYKQQEARSLLQGIPAGTRKDSTVEELVRLALKSS